MESLGLFAFMEQRTRINGYDLYSEGEVNSEVTLSRIYDSFS